MIVRRRLVGGALVVLGIGLAFPAGHTDTVPAGRAATAADLDALHTYIRRAWATLTRTPRDLHEAAVDPKLPPDRGRVPVYVARGEDLRALRAQLGEIDLRPLPARADQIREHGLLYLPRPYVVPGGRFNEMYGWDSYFILRGLLRDGEVQRARDMVDDAVYEVVHFGKVLNAN